MPALFGETQGLAAMHRREVLAGLTVAAITGCAAADNTAILSSPPDRTEHDEVLAALRPPKRARPVIAVIGSPHGAETTDLIVPYGILHRSDLTEVRVVSPTLAPVPLMPALRVNPHLNLAGFDTAFPDGADYVIVPALHRDNDPTITGWIREQHEKGGIICAICAGALVLSNAGLIGDRRATTHWYRIDELRRANPRMQWVRDRRYVVDRGVATTTGISASMPFSLALIEAIAGRETAFNLASQLGVGAWGANHESGAFGLNPQVVWTAIRNRAVFWRQQTFGIPVTDGVDEVSLALVADAYSETCRSIAFATSTDGGRVVTRSGLELVTTKASAAHHLVELAPDQPPAQSLDAALDDIARRYGRDTAAFVALNLEYPWRE